MQKYFKSIKHVGVIMFVITFIAFMLMAFANNRNNIKSSNVSTDFVKISTIQAKDLNKYNAEPLSDGSVNAAMKVAKNDNSMLYQSLRIAATDKINTDTLGNNFVDYIKPNATYQYSETDVDNDGKTFTMVFDMTDKFYTSGTLTLDDLTILIDGEEPNWTEVSKSLQEEDRTNIVNGESKVIGKRYTLTLSNLEQIQVKEGDNYLDYSGVITVAIPADKIVDETGNANNAVTLTSGISLPGGTGTAEVVDVVKPLVEKISSSVDATNGTASLVFRATDKYYASTTLTNANLQITVDGELVESTGITKEVTSTALNEQRLVNGTTQTVQYGIQFTVNLSGLDTSVSQIKVRVPANAILDQSGNGNKETDLLVLNTLRSTSEEQFSNSPFLGNTGLQRNNIDQVEFVDSIPEVVLPSDSSLLRKYDATNNTGNGHSNTTTTWKDLSGHQDGTVHGATWGDNYLSFNGTVSDWVGCGNISVTDKVTIDATIVAKSIKNADNGNNAGEADIIANWNEGGTGLCLTDGVPQFYAYIAGVGNVYVEAKSPITVGEKTRITGSYDGKYMYLYINGKLEAVKAQTGTIKAPTNNTILMMGNNPDGSAVGQWDHSADINIYSASVYNDAVQTNMWDVSAAQDCSIVAWYDTNPNGTYKVYIGSDNEIFGNTDSSYLFNCIGNGINCTSAENIVNIDLLNTSNVTNMSWMFTSMGYANMTKLDLGNNFYTSNVTNMSNMFRGTGWGSMTTLDLGDNFDTSNVTDMNNMFYETGYTAMTSLDLGDKFNTSNVTNMGNMFSETGYTAMTSLDLGDNFDTSKVTNMSWMFFQTGYTAMTNLNLGEKFDTSNVTDMNNMFYETGYTSMTSLDLGNKFDTGNVTNMSEMFSSTGYTVMTSLDLGDKFDTSKVTNMQNMFDCTGFKSLTSLDLGDKFNTSNVTNMINMFASTGYTSMTSLDLGPAFVNIPDEIIYITGGPSQAYADMFNYTGKKGEIVIQAPEAIYQDATHFKSNTDSSTIIAWKEGSNEVTNYGTINPKYRTEWQKENVQTDTTTDANNPKLNITLRGTTNTEVAPAEYISDVTSTLTADGIKIFIDETEITDLVTKTVGTATTTANTRTGAQDVLQTVTLSNFEEAARQAGKQYKEWSGNIRIEIAQGTLSDTTGPADAEGNKVNYGNKNMEVASEETQTGATTGAGSVTEIGARIDNMIQDETKLDHNTEGGMFVDFIKPEFTYEYSTEDINHDEKTLTVEFSVTDKYFNSVTIDQNNITIKMIEENVTPENIQKTLTKVGDINETRNGEEVKIGETYRLVISGFEQTEMAEDGNYKDYSGPVSIAFPASIITDKSGNNNAQKTITVGINEPDQTGDAEVVDVVDPTWKSENLQIDANKNQITVDLIGTDKYYANTTLDISKIKVIVDGEEITSTTNAIKQLSAPTALTESRNGTSTQYGVKYTLTISNFVESDSEYAASGRQYREYSGNTQLVISAGTLIDQSGNESEETTVDVGKVDYIKPEIRKVSSTKNDENKTETIVFDVVDKYFESAQISTTDTSRIHVYVDNEEAIGVTKTITNVEDLTAMVNGSNHIIGKRYTLVISNFEQERTTPVDYDREYSDWSGDVFILIDAATAKDDSGNTN